MNGQKLQGPGPRDLGGGLMVSLICVVGEVVPSVGVAKELVRLPQAAQLSLQLGHICLGGIYVDFPEMEHDRAVDSAA